jgi:hypothetical protein
MSKIPVDKVIARWRLAGGLAGLLSVLQMAIFIALLFKISPIDASINYWLLVLGFCITGVVAAVCMSRTVALGRKARS